MKDPLKHTLDRNGKPVSLSLQTLIDRAWQMAGGAWIGNPVADELEKLFVQPIEVRALRRNLTSWMKGRA